MKLNGLSTTHGTRDINGLLATLNSGSEVLAEKATAGKKTLAEGLYQTAEGLRTGSDRVSDATYRAADAIKCSADYLRRNNFSRIGEDVRRAALRSPLPTLAVALIAGYALGKLATAGRR